MAEPRQSMTPLQRLDAIDAALAIGRGAWGPVGAHTSPITCWLAVCESRAKACRKDIETWAILEHTTGIELRVMQIQAAHSLRAEAEVDTMFKLLGLE